MRRGAGLRHDRQRYPRLRTAHYVRDVRLRPQAHLACALGTGERPHVCSRVHCDSGHLSSEQREILVLAGMPAPAEWQRQSVLGSLSARLKRVEGHSSPVNVLSS